MKSWRYIVPGVVFLYLLGLGWGYVRLPWAAVKSLRDYRLIANAPAISYDPDLNVSPTQRRYLDLALAESEVPVVPRVQVDVQWYAVVVARVKSSHFVSLTGAEWRDSVYVCVFGAWVPVYTFWHVMARTDHYCLLRTPASLAG